MDTKKSSFHSCLHGVSSSKSSLGSSLETNSFNHLDRMDRQCHKAAGLNIQREPASLKRTNTSERP